MEKINCIKYYRKRKNLSISCIFNETLVLSIICNKYGYNNDIIFKKRKY